VTDWTFLSNHGRALLCITRDPTTRLRDIASDLGITERRAYDIVNDLAEAGYVRKTREGRRNRYEVQEHLPLPEDTELHRPIGEVLQMLSGRGSPQPSSRSSAKE
jgi:Sugar-specific transcriptional regulator TrmB